MGAELAEESWNTIEKQIHLVKKGLKKKQRILAKVIKSQQKVIEYQGSIIRYLYQHMISSLVFDSLITTPDTVAELIGKNSGSPDSTPKIAEVLRQSLRENPRGREHPTTGELDVIEENDVQENLSDTDSDVKIKDDENVAKHVKADNQSVHQITVKNACDKDTKNSDLEPTFQANIQKDKEVNDYSKNDIVKDKLKIKVKNGNSNKTKHSEVNYSSHVNLSELPNGYDNVIQVKVSTDDVRVKTKDEENSLYDELDEFDSIHDEDDEEEEEDASEDYWSSGSSFITLADSNSSVFSGQGVRTDDILYNGFGVNPFFSSSENESEKDSGIQEKDEQKKQRGNRENNTKTKFKIQPATAAAAIKADSNLSHFIQNDRDNEDFKAELLNRSSELVNTALDAGEDDTEEQRENRDVKTEEAIEQPENNAAATNGRDASAGIQGKISKVFESMENFKSATLGRRTVLNLQSLFGGRSEKPISLQPATSLGNVKSCEDKDLRREDRDLQREDSVSKEENPFKSNIYRGFLLRHRRRNRGNLDSMCRSMIDLTSNSWSRLESEDIHASPCSLVNPEVREPEMDLRQPLVYSDNMTDSGFNDVDDGHVEPGDKHGDAFDSKEDTLAEQVKDGPRSLNHSDSFLLNIEIKNVNQKRCGVTRRPRMIKMKSKRKI